MSCLLLLFSVLDEALWKESPQRAYRACILNNNSSCSNIGIRAADGSLEFKTDGKMRRKAVKFNPSRSPRRQALFTDLGLLETVVHEEIEASTFKSSSQPLRGMRKIEGDRQV
jgi:hypothetical protein